MKTVQRGWAKRASVLGATVAVTSALLYSQTGAAPTLVLPEVPSGEVLLRAMRDELARVPQLAAIAGKDAPYYTSYTVSDADSLRILSSLGAPINVLRNAYRSPLAEMRTGSYEYDNTGHVNSGAYTGTALDGDWPLDANYTSLRNSLWLTTDRVFKTALESMSRKRAAQTGTVAEANPLPNFSRAEPVVSIPKVEMEKVDQPEWEARANRMSAIFRRYPDVLSSSVELQIMTGITTMLTSEGTMIRYEDGIGWAIGKAEAQAPDGMVVHDATTVQALTVRAMPPEAEITKSVTAVADNVRALAKAPAGEAYTGPVLFEPGASAQLLAQVLGENLRISRRPLTSPGQNANVVPSELETRLNSRVLPEFFDVTDDPTQRLLNGKPLAGYYEFDLEGVRPKPVSLIEKGVLKNVLTTRTPVRGFAVSNGHARLPGNYGARMAAIGNLFVKARESRPLADLKKQLMDIVAQTGKPYGMLVRKLDFPFGGSTQEIQAVIQANAQGGGAVRPVSPPLLVYRVYPDGREELVRGLRFHGLSARTLRDILAASDETAVFEYVNTSTLMALLGSGGYLAPTSVIAPGLLFEEVEFETPREQFPKPAIVPAPPMQP